MIPRYCQIMYTLYSVNAPCLTVILYMRFMVKLARYRRLGEHPLVSTGRVGPVQHHQHLHPNNADPPRKSGHCRWVAALKDFSILYFFSVGQLINANCPKYHARWIFAIWNKVVFFFLPECFTSIHCQSKYINWIGRWRHAIPILSRNLLQLRNKF